MDANAYGGSFQHTKIKEHSLPYYLLIAEGKIAGFISFLKVLVLCEMLILLSGIWTRGALFTPYDGNHYTSDTDYIYLYQLVTLAQSAGAVEYIGCISAEG